LALFDSLTLADIGVLLTMFGLFGGAMFWLGKTHEKLGNHDKKLDKFEKEFKDDVKDLQKDFRDISIKLYTYIAARNELDRLREDKK